jgi:hypothetical protein
MEVCAVLLNTCKPGLFVMNKILVMQVKQWFVLHSYMEKEKVVPYNISLCAKYRQYLCGFS